MPIRVPCPGCRSSGGDASGNNLTLFDDDPSRGYCFKCRKSYSVSGEKVQRTKQDFVDLEVVKTYPVRVSRGLPVSQEVLERYGVRSSIDEQTGEVNAVYYPYHDQDKNVVGYKVRRLPKTFSVIGKVKGMFGQAQCKNNAKLLIITEGEKDTLAVFEMLNRKGKDWNVVSLPNGANEAGEIDEATRRELEWIVSHEKILLCFDTDAPGRETAKALAELIASQSTVAIMDLPRKDAAELLIHGEEELWWKALSGSKPYRPECIVEGKDISLAELRKPKQPGYELPYPQLQRMTWGLRKGEITTISAGSGIGKSLWAREIMYHMAKKHGLRVANIALETTMEDMVRYYIAMDNNVPGYKLMFNPDCIPEREYERSYREIIASGKMDFFKHWGSLDADLLMNKMYYFAKVLKVDFILLDHVSMVIAGNDSQNERKDIDKLFERETKLVTETGVGIVNIIHLKRVAGKNYNKGDEVELVDLRGSSGAEAMSFNVWALERNQQADEQSKRDVVKIRVLKNRLTGFTGLAGAAIYDHESGRLNPLETSYEGE